MPSCAIIVCGNRSCAANFKSCGVTYHLFPKVAEFKEKWIDATGRSDKWFPTSHSVICSTHFLEECFQASGKSRRLFPWAVPTLKLRLVYEDASEPSTTEKITTTTEQHYSPNNISPRDKKIKLIYETKYKNAMKAKTMQVKRLQTMVRRYRKKFVSIKKVLKVLKEENAINETHLWLLDSVNLTS